MTRYLGKFKISVQGKDTLQFSKVLARDRDALLRRSTGKRGSVSDERSATTPA